MEIMKQMNEARAAYHRAEVEMDKYVKEAISDVDLGGALTTIHYTSDNLLVSIYHSGDEGKEVRLTIDEIDFSVTCDIELKKLIRIAELINGADQILIANALAD